MKYREELMKEAIDMAIANIDSGGGPFGAVVVRDGKVIGRGCNSVTNNLDPTAHAEVMAIRDACRNLNTFILDGCQIYSSCEPCPMCLSAIYWARIDHVYYGCTKLDAADAGFDDSFIYKEFELPVESRAIKIEEHDRNISIPVFEKWISKENKVKY